VDDSLKRLVSLGKAGACGRPKGLRARLARSGAILAVGSVGEKTLAFVSRIVLARLLMPAELGLIILIVSISALFEVLTEVGVKQSVIRSAQGDRDAYLNMAWWFQVVRAGAIYVLAFLFAPVICRFYFNDRTEILGIYAWPELYLMVRIAFVTIVCNSMMSPRMFLLEREFRFGKYVLIMQGGAWAGLILTIVLAVCLRNAWAMVLGVVCQALLRTVLSYIGCPFRPRFKYDGHSFLELAAFARGMFGAPMLAYFAYNADALFGGRLVSPDLLGYYGYAVALARAPRELFAKVINPMLLPAFATKKGDWLALREGTVKLTSLVATVGVPFLTLGIIHARTILGAVFGEDFTIVSVSFGLFCVNVFFILQAIILANVLLALGKPSKQRLYVALRAVLIGIAIIPAIKSYGMAGAAGTLAAANFVALCSLVYMVHKEIALSVCRYFASWRTGFLSLVPVLVVAVLLQKAIPSHPFIRMFSGVLLCVLITGPTCLRLFARGRRS